MTTDAYCHYSGDPCPVGPFPHPAEAACLTPRPITARGPRSRIGSMEAACEVCGDTSRACRFEKACSCWRGMPCRP